MSINKRKQSSVVTDSSNDSNDGKNDVTTPLKRARSTRSSATSQLKNESSDDDEPIPVMSSTHSMTQTYLFVLISFRLNLIWSIKTE
jgi:hypothetical protein